MQDSNYSDKLRELRHEELAWIRSLGDKGAIPEKEILVQMWLGVINP